VTTTDTTFTYERKLEQIEATRSTQATRNAQTKRTTSGAVAHSYKSLLAELTTLTRNTIRLSGTPATFDKLAQPNPTQARALELAEHAPVLAWSPPIHPRHRQTQQRRHNHQPQSGELRALEKATSRCVRGRAGPLLRCVRLPVTRSGDRHA
jgi:hypothetical protein